VETFRLTIEKTQRAARLDSPTQRANVALMPTRTIAYLRVSTEKQADRGVSLDAQRAKVKAYAQLYELELTEVIVDAGESATRGIPKAAERRASRLD
jgi:predicted site-specific integrase-resolvase